jgi:hypothetical protein
MVIKIQIFMLGFLVNAGLWKFDQGGLIDIILPAISIILCILIIISINRNPAKQ